jgi:hypothetical protein
VRETIALSIRHLVTLAPVLAFAALPTTAAPAHAHDLRVECKLKGDIVSVEGFFTDGTPARDAKVTVRDPQGTEIAAGRTDDAGRWTFPRPAAGKYEVLVTSNDGHRSRPAVATIPTEAALNAITPAPDEIIVTSGPTREELTRFPWLRLALGVAAIGGLAVLLWLASRGRGAAP